MYTDLKNRKEMEKEKMPTSLTDQVISISSRVEHTKVISLMYTDLKNRKEMEKEKMPTSLRFASEVCRRDLRLRTLGY